MGELIHTPGPWKWEDKTDGNPQYELRPQVIMGSNENVVFVSGADAKLIAAAPDLLAALMGCVESLKTMDKNPFDEFNYSRAIDAIEKATSE